MQACTPPASRDILAPEKMQSIVWDLLRADEMAGYYATRDTSLNHLRTYTDLYQSILEIHHITRNDLKKNIRYYQGHPLLFKVILDSVQHLAERQQRKADSATWLKPSEINSVHPGPKLDPDTSKQKNRLIKFK